jgi:hypothetical protein
LVCALAAARARADLGQDLERLKRALVRQTRAEPLRMRLMERGDVTPIVLPPWSLDRARGECTTLIVLGPAPTQFLLHVHPWPGLQSVFASQAGALQLTRCGRERISFLQVLVEMRSPRAVVHTLVAVGSDAPQPLAASLPERDTGPAAPPGDPGPAPAREPLAERVRRFEETAHNAGATGVETALLPSHGYVRLMLEPGCHRLLATAADGAPRYTLLLGENDEDAPARLEATEDGDVRHELCTARARRLLVSLDTSPVDVERKLAVAHFALPLGLPTRFGPELAERLVSALGAGAAPRKLGALVVTTLGAQGRTPLPRRLLAQTCYLAAAVVVHGGAQALSLGARAGASNAEATSNGDEPGPHLGFCTGPNPEVELDVEARGLGLAWGFFLFQMAPAKPEAP